MMNWGAGHVLRRRPILLLLPLMRLLVMRLLVVLLVVLRGHLRMLLVRSLARRRVVGPVLLLLHRWRRAVRNLGRDGPGLQRPRTVGVVVVAPMAGSAGLRLLMVLLRRRLEALRIAGLKPCAG